MNRIIGLCAVVMMTGCTVSEDDSQQGTVLLWCV